MIYPQQRVFGEISPSNALAGSAVFERMAAVHPDTRFLFLMRNPVDRLWSHFKHRIRGSGGEMPSELDLTTLPQKRLDSIIAKSRYDQTVADLDAAVPPSAVFCMLLRGPLF